MRCSSLLLLRVEHSRALHLVSVVRDLTAGSHVVHRLLLEFFSLKDGSWLGTVLQDASADLFVRVFFISDGTPIHSLVFAWGQVHNSELSIVTQLSHLPLQVVLVVPKEDLLG